MAAHRGRLDDALAHISDLAGLLHPSELDGPALWLAELWFFRLRARAGFQAGTLQAVAHQLAAVDEGAGRALELRVRAYRGARMGLAGRLGQADLARHLWEQLRRPTEGTLRLHEADWMTDVLSLWADSPHAGVIPTSLWRRAARVARPYPLFRLRLQRAAVDAAVRTGHVRRAGRVVRRALPLARQLGGLAGAALLGRAVQAVGGPTSPDGLLLLEEALEAAADATPGLPEVNRLLRLAGRPTPPLMALPRAATARAVGLQGPVDPDPPGAG